MRLHFNYSIDLCRRTVVLTTAAVACCMASGCAQSEPVYVASHFFRKSSPSRKLIVFVHGIFGDADSTWSALGAKQSWPELLVGDPETKDFDVYTYGYRSPKLGPGSDIYQIATRFGQELKDSGMFNYEELYFVTHSMGGLVTKATVVLRYRFFLEQRNLAPATICETLPGSASGAMAASATFRLA